MVSALNLQSRYLASSMLFLATYPFSAELEPPMSMLQFVDSMVGRLAWPLVVLFLAFMLRKQLAALAERVLEASFGGATVKFGEMLAKGTEIVDEAPKELKSAKAPVDVQLLEERTTQTQDTIDMDETVAKALRRHVVDDMPSRNVFGAFEKMEAMLNQIGAALNDKRKGTMLMRHLYRSGLLPNDITELYKNLRRARNAIAHGEANLPNEAEALEYIRQANFVFNQLSNALNTLQADGKIEGPPG